MLTVAQVDEVRARVLHPEPSVLADLSDFLTFEAPGAQFDPRVKKGTWDGRIRLMGKDSRGRTIPIGLVPRVKEWCRENDIPYQDDLRKDEPCSLQDAEDHVASLKIPEEFDQRDYQLRALQRAIQRRRQLFVSPTSSGKSMIIYTVITYYGGRALIVVPTTGLVGQMKGDLESYGFKGKIHVIQDGRDIPSGTDVVVSTWQSIYELDADWFEQFNTIIGDEAHLFSAQSLTGIMNKATTVVNRFGFTGTLKGSKCHQLQLEGLFGETMVVTTTRELMDRGYVADLKMECLVLNWPKSVKKELQDRIETARKDPKNRKQKKGAIAYRTELDMLYTNEARNRFLVKMASRLQGNVLILFHHVEHGDKLFDMIVQETDRPVHLVNGGVSGLERNEIRELVEESDNAILVASVGTTSTGVSIRRINHLIMASPWKSRIVVLQSVGRGLRMADDKTKVSVYDVSDELSWNGVKNHTLNHMVERVRTYAEESFEYKVHKIDMPDK